VNNGLDLTTVRNFSTALLIGALVGIEREKRTSAEAEAGIGGCESSSSWRFGGASASPPKRGHHGVPARRHDDARLPRVAVALGIVTAAVLVYKQPLHGLVEKTTERVKCGIVAGSGAALRRPVVIATVAR
jgi:hypothetical protein